MIASQLYHCTSLADCVFFHARYVVVDPLIVLRQTFDLVQLMHTDIY